MHAQKGGQSEGALGSDTWANLTQPNLFPAIELSFSKKTVKCEVRQQKKRWSGHGYSASPEIPGHGEGQGSWEAEHLTLMKRNTCLHKRQWSGGTRYHRGQKFSWAQRKDLLCVEGLQSQGLNFWRVFGRVINPQDSEGSVDGVREKSFAPASYPIAAATGSLCLSLMLPLPEVDCSNNRGLQSHVAKPSWNSEGLRRSMRQRNLKYL